MHQPTGGRSGTRWTFVAESAAYVVACSLGFLAADRFMNLDGVSVWYPPAALTFAYLVRVGLAGVPVALATRLGAALTIMEAQFHLRSAVVTGTLVVAAYTVAALSFRRLRRPRGARADASLMVAHGAAAALLAAVACVTWWVASGPEGADRFASMTWTFWLGDASAILTLAPALLLPGTRGDRPAAPSGVQRLVGAAEWGVVLATVLGAAWIAEGADPSTPLFYPSFLPVGWMAIRRGIRGGAVVVAATGVAIPVAALLADATTSDMVGAQVFLVSLSLAGLGLGGTETDRLVAHAAVEASEAQLSQAVRAAREAEALQRISLEALEQGVVLVTPSGGVALMNPAARHILQTDPAGLTAAFTDGGWDLWHEDGTPVPRHEQPFARTLHTGETVENQIVVWERRPGERIVIRVRTEPVVGESGDLEGIVAAFADVTAERAAEQVRAEAAVAIAEAEAELRRSFEQSAMPTAFIGPDGRIRRVNQAVCDLLGYEAAELVDRRALSVVHPDDLPTERHVPEAEAEGRLVRRDGSAIWARVATGAVRAPGGEIDHFVVQITDITEARAAQAELRASQSRFAALVEHSADVIAVLDGDGHLTYLSPAGHRLLRAGGRLIDAVVPDDRAALTALLLDIAGRPGASDTIEVLIGTLQGPRNLEIALTNRLDDPHVLGVVANMRDVTERVEAASRLEWQAYHDDLTGLPNRAMLIERIEASLDRARGSGTVTALLYIDLDRFKLVNDTLGHETGDNLLVVIADRLTRLIGARGTVARLGGDEFVILLERLADRRDGTDLAERITTALAEPVRLGSTLVSSAASIGIAFDAGHTPETLLRDADTALYRAKDKGKNRYEVFDDSLRAAALRKVSTEALLRRALDEDELQVHYQPVVDLVSGQVIGAEALLRVPGPGGELQSPAEFIVVAEETGLIVPIGAGILDEACRTLSRWLPGAGGRQIAVNVSPRQLASAGFADVVERTLEAHQLRADQLVLELTETALIQADRVTTEVIARLHALGVGLAIDDFGTGYGSLAYLKRFPVTTVKIDQSFVAGLGTDANDTEIVRAITSLGRSLGLFVVAEGIETREQLEELQALGCDAGQGYLFAPALPRAALAEIDDQVVSRFAGRVDR